MEPQIKADEEYPLLRVEAGGGDSKIRNSVPTAITTTGWNITCTPKQSWCSRWPEFVSAFWMTLILLAISFLVFYALGMSVYRRQPIVIVRCNDTNVKPGSDVFYHHIIARNAYVTFTLFSDYLSFMATQYPSLRFYVYFLIDDSWYPNPKVSKRPLRLLPHMSSPFNTVFNQNHKRDIRDFQKRYQNVHINIMYLSKYMAMTPLKYKWKIIPQNYLTFYARIYEIWKNGGIGFDLVQFNNHFNINKEIDHRIDAILKQHNNGFDLEKYEVVLDSINNEEQNELFSMFFNLMNHILNETSLFFNTDTITNVTVINNDPIIKTNRIKRDIVSNMNVFNVTNRNSTANYNHTRMFNEINHNGSLKQEPISTDVKNKNGSSLHTAVEVIKQLDIKLPNITGYQTEIPQVWFFYDISGFPDETGPAYFLPKSMVQSGEVIKTASSNQKMSNYLLLSPDGYFVAASARHHPFLAQLFSSSCHTLNPKFAIKEALFSQCSGFLRDDVYCENIRIMYNLI